ncbi:MAG: hypothetical protein US31_C0002G0084 [Berkelbacteria bacterium GW2011_GWA1_36_9]|uniref:Uncharacterized protein n=1 Tax=Berkelbacteria bacterium GW2011_GWA1_36_9 TaxID=1618331 RepID=A0A0G0I3A7_9BACT|nr:MAG: hypothetical protein US31_C0002G0084 [Berkelbacteria bacterium GW2011_GWA1_36_9]
MIFSTFLSAIFIPGYVLSRVIKIQYEGFVGQLILWLTLGLSFNLLLCFLAVVGGLTISVFLQFYFVAMALLLIVAFVLELLKPADQEIKISLNYREIFKAQNLIYFFLFILIVLVLVTVDQLGTNFTGDPFYHLSFMRKAIEGQPMTINNLSYLKNDFPIAYVIPLSHVFLTLFVKLTNSNIFTLYRELSTVLTLISFLVWYWLFVKVLPNRQVAFLALFLLILYYFDKNAYLYTRLAIPDTFGNLILLPLSFGLVINYVFDKSSTYKHLIIVSLMIALMGLYHFTQYFYFLLAMGLWVVLYAIFNYKKEDFWLILKKIFQCIFVNMILIVPILLFWLLKNNTFSKSLQVFSAVTRTSNNDRFEKFSPYMQLSYVFLPFIILFFKKYRSLIFLLSVFLVGPLIYNIPGLENLMRHYFSHIFVNRLYGNLGEWPYAIWALVLFFLFILVDRLMIKLNAFSKYLKYLINSVLVVILGWMFYLQSKEGKILSYYNQIFRSEGLHNWLSGSYHWLIPLTMAVALALYIGQKYSLKINNFFEFKNIQNQSTVLILMLIVVFFILSPAYNHLSVYANKVLVNNHFFSVATDPTLDIINPTQFGGMETIEFIKNNIPSKSVFDTNSRANYSLPTLVDVHMASWTNNDDVDPTKLYQGLYEKIPLNDKLNLLKKGDIDYIIYVYNKNKELAPFEAYPKYFKKIYTNTNAVIFQIDKIAVKNSLY